MSTVHASSDSENAYFTATLPGLSYFAIAGRAQEQPVVVNETDPIEPAEITGAAVDVPVDTSDADTSSDTSNKWLYAILTLFIAGIVSVFGWRYLAAKKGNKKKTLRKP
jgi:hypothetical protein